MNEPFTLRVAGDLLEWIDAAVELFVEHAQAAIDARGRFIVSLAGGNTPKQIYDALADDDEAQALDWKKIIVLFGDERCVEVSDPLSNAGMAQEALFDHVAIPKANIHRMRGERSPFEAADDYEVLLSDLLGGTPGTGDAPEECIDLSLLGLGGNGHTASLFPGLTWSVLPKRWVIAEYVEVTKSWRLSLTPLVLNAARQSVFLVEGSAKSEIVAQVLEGPFQPIVLPSQNIQGALWLLDDEAASELRKK